MATAGIRSHISNLSPTTVFTTRDVLKYGKRGAVDQCLCHLVKMGAIRRLARGVFVQDKNTNPSIDEIARIKAAAFGKRIYKFAADVLSELGILRQKPAIDELESNAKAEGKTFAINGGSSGFQSFQGLVKYKGIAQRKAKLCESAIGEKVNALWHFRTEDQLDRAVNIVFRNLNRTTRLELRACSNFMPGWLNDMFIERFVRTVA
ncbi:MAG TPA: hypothetical protein V6C86_26995 [Oculatellaceae cyanobacterium]